MVGVFEIKVWKFLNVPFSVFEYNMASCGIPLCCESNLDYEMEDDPVMKIG